MPWQYVPAVVNSRLRGFRRRKLQHLVRAARTRVAEWLLPEAVPGRATLQQKDYCLPMLAVAMRAERPYVTLQEMRDMLEEMRVPTPRAAHPAEKACWHGSRWK